MKRGAFAELSGSIESHNGPIAEEDYRNAAASRTDDSIGVAPRNSKGRC